MSHQKKKAQFLEVQKKPPIQNEHVEEDMDISEDEEGLYDPGSCNSCNLSNIVDSGGTRVGGIYIPAPIKAYCSTESKGPRLVIRFIENTNFKSYANTVRVGPFHHVRFSSVPTAMFLQFLVRIF